MPEITHKYECIACGDSHRNSKGGICKPCFVNGRIIPYLLTQQCTPKPLYGLTTKDLDPKRYRALKKLFLDTKKNCLICGAKERKIDSLTQLVLHDVIQVDYTKGIAEYTNSIAICYACHYHIETDQLYLKFLSGEISRETYQKILDHGDFLLKIQGMKKRECESLRKVCWSDWKLKYEGKFYKSKYKDLKAWKRANLPLDSSEANKLVRKLKLK